MNGPQDNALTQALADAVTDPDPARVAGVTARLAGLSGPGWLRLDESARRSHSGESPLDQVADWRPMLAAGGVAVNLAAASMYRDGRVREAAVAALDRTTGAVAAAALAVRVADWVPQIGSAASAALTARTEPDDIAAIISVLLALRQRRRGERTAARYLAGIAAGPAATLEMLARPGERARRLWALATLESRGLLSAPALGAQAMRDPDPSAATNSRSSSWAGCSWTAPAPSGQSPGGAGAGTTGTRGPSTGRRCPAPVDPARSRPHFRASLTTTTFRFPRRRSPI